MFPTEFTERLRHNLGPLQAERILASMTTPKAIGLWENPLRCDPQPALTAQSAKTPVDSIVQALCRAEDIEEVQGVSVALPGCYRVAARYREVLMHSEWVGAGLIYPMNPSSLFAATALGVLPGDEVLDLAAAPGGKSLVLAAALSVNGEPSGRLALVEPIKARFHRLRANMQRCGVAHADYYQRDGRTVGAAVPERFDRVLLDAPCSSEARFHSSDPTSVQHWNLRKVRECARKQKSLLKSAFRALKPGGTLIYSTCSFSLEENERIVDGFLRRETAAQLVPVEVADDLGGNFVSAITEVEVVSNRKQQPGGASRRKMKRLNCAGALRVLPDDLWDGFFLAKLTKRPV